MTKPDDQVLTRDAVRQDLNADEHGDKHRHPDRAAGLSESDTASNVGGWLRRLVMAEQAHDDAVGQAVAGPRRGVSDEPERRTPGTLITYLTAIGLFSYLPLRALQEGFYQPFGLTGNDVGLDQSRVLTQAAVCAGFLLGVSFLGVLLGGGIGRACRARVRRFRLYIRILLALGAVFLPWIARLLLALSTAPPHWPAGYTWKLDLLMLPFTGAMAVCLLFEDVAAGLARASVRAQVGGGFVLLVVVTGVAYAMGQQMAVDVAADQSPSLTTRLLLTEPVIAVTISTLPPATDIPPEQGFLPRSGLLLGTDGSTAYIRAGGNTWRVPASTVVLRSFG